MIFTIKRKTESNNEIKRMHWAVYKKCREEWTLEVMCAMPVGARGQHGNEKKYLEITRYGTKKLDRDNLWGGVKLLVDSIVDMGLMVDDSDEWCHMNVKQEICEPGEERTKIKIKKF